MSLFFRLLMIFVDIESVEIRPLIRYNFGMDEIKEFQEALLNWYRKSGRVLPWRSDPSPYKVWISEIMLQQTRVDTVIPYFNRFISEISTIKDLAETDDEKLYKLWQGLGYYRRASHLKKAAQIMVDQYNDRLPENFNDLLTLPGIGAYTAGAILSIAFNISIPAVDGNVFRIMARINAETGDIQKASVKKRLEACVKELIPSTDAGDFNQALMDLGANICIPNGIPKCEECPVKNFCKAYSEGLAYTLPVKGNKAVRKTQEITVLKILRDNRLAIRKREEKGLLSNLWELPNYQSFLTEEQCIKILQNNGFKVTSIMPMERVKHAFSHMDWIMIGYLITVEGNEDLSSWTWVTREEILNVYSIPSAFLPFLSV